MPESRPARFTSRRSPWLAFVGSAAAWSAILAQGSLTTSDGLKLTLSAAGAISSLQVSGAENASAMPSGFFFRELAATTPNLVSIGSFESGSSVPTNWTISGGTGGTWSIDATTSSSGSRSMKISIPGSTAKRSPDLKSAAISILPNTPYTLSVNVRTSGLTYALTLFLYEVDSAGNTTRRQLSSLTGTNGWLAAPLRLNFVSGADADHVFCDAFVYNGYGTAWIDDVGLTDVFGGNRPVNFTGSVTSSGGVLTQTASSNGLRLSATFASVGLAIRVDATLTDSTGADRALELAYRLPLDVPGWTWDDDFVTPITIANGTRYENLATQFNPAQTHSVYPFATVRNSATAFSLAVPMGPALDRLAYDTRDGFRISWDLGLSPAAAKTPSKATVSFWIYAANARWGLRAAAEKYYALNPASFTSTAAASGSLALPNKTPLSSVPNPQDFGWAFEEGDGELAFDNSSGILGLHYVDPSGWFRTFNGYSSQPPYTTLINTLLADAVGATGTTTDFAPVTEMAQAVINSSPYDSAGNYEVFANPYFWYNGYAQIYPVAPDPDIPAPSMYSVIKRYGVDNRIAMAQSAGHTLGGILLDDLTWVFSSLENYRRPLWAFSDFPLSFSYSSRKVTLFNGASMTEFCAGMNAYLHSRGLILTGSLTAGDYVWFAQSLDEVGGETTSGAEGFSWAYTRRALSFGKPWSNLFVSHTTAPTGPQVLTYLRQALFLGFHPGFNGVYWDDPAAYERDRPLFQQYISLIRSEAAAGWQPVTYATSSDPAIYVERFGAPSTFFISAQNTGSSTSSPQFTIDGAGLHIAPSAGVAVTELLSGTPLPVTVIGSALVFSDALATGETRLYRVVVSATPPPVIGSAAPGRGPSDGGTNVTITGSGFQNGLSVRIGGVPAPVQSVAPGSVVATTGPHTSGPADVQVTNPDGQIAALRNGFTYEDGSAQPGLGFYPLIPCRVLDTRSAPGPLGGPALAANTLRTFTLAGQCGIPADAAAVSVNVTVTLSTASGGLQLFAGSTPPGTSSISYGPGKTRANNTTVALGTSGDMSVFCGQSSGTVQMIMDVNGYFR